LDEKCQSKKVPALAWGQGHKLQAASSLTLELGYNRMNLSMTILIDKILA
jgi:hypothetical protein